MSDPTLETDVATSAPAKTKRPFVAPALTLESPISIATQVKTFPIGAGDEHNSASLTQTSLAGS